MPRLLEGRIKGLLQGSHIKENVKSLWYEIEQQTLGELIRFKPDVDATLCDVINMSVQNIPTYEYLNSEIRTLLS